MQRRNFIKHSIAATALVVMARGAEPSAVSARASEGFRIGAGKDRYDEDLLIMGGRFGLKVSTRDTGGDLCIYDTVRWEKGGPSLHRHHFQDEWFYIVRGRFVVRVDDDTFELNPGDSAFVPRKTPHAFAMTSDGEGQMLVLFQPAGSIEDYFKQVAKFGKEIPKSRGAERDSLAADHGMEILGPPLKF